MAGTIVADTIQDGAGNSTSMDNAIYGSAKAWVEFTGITTVTVGASYNVSSVTRRGTGQYTVNFTSAFADANYSGVYGCRSAAGNAMFFEEDHDTPVRTTTQINLQTFSIGVGNQDLQIGSAVFNR